MHRTELMAIAALILLVGAASGGEKSGQSVGPDLPPRVRALLVEEMKAILAAADVILDGLIRGADEVVAQQAEAIHRSFILKKEMTAADRRAMLSSVPPAFVERDRAFHELSARLAAAARQGDRARQRRLFADMIGACVECHSRHAAGRFPGFDGGD